MFNIHIRVQVRRRSGYMSPYYFRMAITDWRRWGDPVYWHGIKFLPSVPSRRARFNASYKARKAERA